MGTCSTRCRCSRTPRSRRATYLYPRVEVEVGFILAADLPGADCTEDDVLAATEALVPSIELIDTRITDWKIALCDTIADNASSAGFVLGEARVSPVDVDVKAIDAVLARNGEVVGGGAQRRGAGQSGDRGGVVGPQGGKLWGAAEER